MPNLNILILNNLTKEHCNLAVFGLVFSTPFKLDQTNQPNMATTATAAANATAAAAVNPVAVATSIVEIASSAAKAAKIGFSGATKQADENFRNAHAILACTRAALTALQQHGVTANVALQNGVCSPLTRANENVREAENNVNDAKARNSLIVNAAAMASDVADAAFHAAKLHQNGVIQMQQRLQLMQNQLQLQLDSANQQLQQQQQQQALQQLQQQQQQAQQQLQQQQQQAQQQRQLQIDALQAQITKFEQ